MVEVRYYFEMMLINVKQRATVVTHFLKTRERTEQMQTAKKKYALHIYTLPSRRTTVCTLHQQTVPYFYKILDLFFSSHFVMINKMRDEKLSEREPTHGDSILYILKWLHKYFASCVEGEQDNVFAAHTWNVSSLRYTV